MATAKMTLLGMYGYFHSIDDDLFKNLHLPEGLELETFRDTLFLDYGERAVLYTNPDLMQSMIGAWSNKWALELTRIAKTLLEDYEPLWNIDRYEDVDDATRDTASESIDGTVNSTTGTTNNQTIENKTSAYNSSEYQPEGHTTINGTGSETLGQTSGQDKENEYARDFAHRGHYYGNGGVTMSQQMAKMEVDLREKYNLYHEACKLFADDLLLYMY